MCADRPTARTNARQRAACVMATLLLVTGCATIAPAPQTAPTPMREEGEAAARVLAFQRGMQTLGAAELARERRRLSADRGAWSKMQLALLALHPRSLNLLRARALLDSVLAAPDTEAQSLHDFARLLLEQVNERLRLEALNERQAQQLERGTSQLEQASAQVEELRSRADALQRKLDALAQIERDLSAPSPQPPTSPPPAGPAGSTPPEDRTPLR